MQRIESLIEELRDELKLSLEKAKDISSRIRWIEWYENQVHINASKCVWEIRTAKLRYKNILKDIDGKALITLDDIKEPSEENMEEYDYLLGLSKELSWPWKEGMNKEDKYRLNALTFLNRSHGLKRDIEEGLSVNEKEDTDLAIKNYKWYLEYSK